MKKNITFVCGATGGHVYPAIAVAEQLHNHHCQFIINKNRQAESILQQLNKSMISISCHSKNIIQLINVFFTTRKLLKSTHLLIGTGGFITSIVALAAKSRNIPIILLEQNVLPGKATRYSQYIANYICTSFPQSSQYLNQKKCILTGNPVRNPEQSNPQPYITNSSNQKWLIFGGSQGAKFINQLIISNSHYFIKNNIDIIHITGLNQFDEWITKSPHHHIDNTKQHNSSKYNTYTNNTMTYTLINYVTDIHHLYKWCSLAVSRSGATSVAELFHYKVSAILIPYPHAADNHQELNAKAFCKHSNGYYINQHNVTFDKLIAVAKKTQNKQSTSPSFTLETTKKITALITKTLQH